MREGDLAMEHPDRITYQTGFYYEPLTEEIKQRIYGLSYKEDCSVPYEELRYVVVRFVNFDGETEDGEIICNKAIAQDLVEIFYALFEQDYPIEKIKLIDEFEADDDLSCAANNTSCFNYRVIAGSKTLSRHALGMAIDINPFYNPYITYPNGKERISPAGSEPYADRDADLPYMIKKGDLCYNLFIEHGFTWGGEWKSVKDYQHFQKETD
ncbi:MAG: M15 family metallopeptidase [Lachnospiraceae bacterium]|nr:M15 family metallopeptidase [Lachnospiraceae bacterium]